MCVFTFTYIKERKLSTFCEILYIYIYVYIYFCQTLTVHWSVVLHLHTGSSRTRKQQLHKIAPRMNLRPTEVGPERDEQASVCAAGAVTVPPRHAHGVER